MCPEPNDFLITNRLLVFIWTVAVSLIVGSVCWYLGRRSATRELIGLVRTRTQKIESQGVVRYPTAVK